MRFVDLRILGEFVAGMGSGSCKGKRGTSWSNHGKAHELPKPRERWEAGSKLEKAPAAAFNSDTVIETGNDTRKNFVTRGIKHLARLNQNHVPLHACNHTVLHTPIFDQASITNQHHSQRRNPPLPCHIQVITSPAHPR